MMMKSKSIPPLSLKSSFHIPHLIEALSCHKPAEAAWNPAQVRAGGFEFLLLAGLSLCRVGLWSRSRILPVFSPFFLALPHCRRQLNPKKLPISEISTQ